MTPRTRYHSPCLIEIAPNTYTCTRRGITFTSSADVVKCCADAEAAPPPAPRSSPGAPDTTAAPWPPQLCADCRHLDHAGKCRLIPGCDARQYMKSVAARGYCRHRNAEAQATAPLIGTLPRDAFITTPRMIRDALDLAARLDATRFNWVAGVARSGLPAAAVIATHYHLPLAVIYPGGTLDPIGTGYRMGRTPTAPRGPGLVIDDTICTGQTLRHIREALANSGHHATTAAIYASPRGLAHVDAAAYLYPEPHFLEWNFANNVFTDRLAWDFDGILCPDPPGPDTDPSYRHHLQEALPLITPRRNPIVILSARHESTRPATEAWLRKHGIRWRQLILWTHHPDARWHTPTTVAEWKARQLDTLRPVGITGYVESDPGQAAIIAESAKMPVICPAAGRVFNINTDGTDGQWSHSGT